MIKKATPKKIIPKRITIPIPRDSKKKKQEIIAIIKASNDKYREDTSA
jgi:hypothetical protein